jgi:hypothetical protein
VGYWGVRGARRQGNGGDYIMRSLSICTAHPIFFSGDKIETYEMGGACSAYGGGERRVQGFGAETWGKVITGETQA